MLSKILAAEKRYSDGFKKVLAQRKSWENKAGKVTDRLQQIADYLNKHSSYQQEYSVDSYPATDEQSRSVCDALLSVVFSSGNVDMQLDFHDKKNKRSSIEMGFQLVISPTVSGGLVVYVIPHYSDFTHEEIQPVILEHCMIPTDLNNEKIDQWVIRSLEVAYESSFTGMLCEREPMKPNMIGYKLPMAKEDSELDGRINK